MERYFMTVPSKWTTIWDSKNEAMVSLASWRRFTSGPN
jgi:hypothetical protein